MRDGNCEKCGEETTVGRDPVLLRDKVYSKAPLWERVPAFGFTERSAFLYRGETGHEYWVEHRCADVRQDDQD